MENGGAKVAFPGKVKLAVLELAEIKTPNYAAIIPPMYF